MSTDPASSLPSSWPALWGSPAAEYLPDVGDMRSSMETLAAALPLERDTSLSDMVGPQDNYSQPVHRWYQYKEAFSHRLPRTVVGRYGTGTTRVVGDLFAGVATTPLSLLADTRVNSIVGIEYSPFAHFVGATKLSWPELDPRSLEKLARKASSFKCADASAIPDLSSFHNVEIFEKETVRALVGARAHIESLKAPPMERDFLLLGVAAVVEDLSGAMKDGRALRIARGRRRRSTSLVPQALLGPSESDVRIVLSTQWAEMIADLDALAPVKADHQKGTAHLVRGDARVLVAGDEAAGPFEAGSVGLLLYSPPYLNCIDYTEVYKLELWLLGFVDSQAQFREVRQGTLRSHPSIEFPPTHHLNQIKDSAVAETIELISTFVTDHGERPGIGRMIRNYFEDMFRSLTQQAEVLEPGGHALCVVGNSTFSRRQQDSEGRSDMWRIPLLTDVLLARLGEAAGFSEASIIDIRDLRARNVRAGVARESIVVLRR